MHSLAVVLIPFEPHSAGLRPLAARDAAAWARIDMLLFRYQQPEDRSWGVDSAHGFKFDWWTLGGRWPGWGRRVRELMNRQRIRPTQRPIPRFLEPNAVWTEDFSRVRLNSSLQFPMVVVTPYGDWIECPSILFSWGRPTGRERKAKAVWLRRVRKLMEMCPSCLAIAVDYHW
jgi:hypothetical protein